MTILAVSMTIHPGKVEECIHLLKQMRAETLKEPGCLQYDTIQSDENPLQFFFYERTRMTPHWRRTAPPRTLQVHHRRRGCPGGDAQPRALPPVD